MSAELWPESLVGSARLLRCPSVSFLRLSLKLNGLYDCPRENRRGGAQRGNSAGEAAQGRNGSRQTQSGSIAYRLHFPPR